MPVFKQRDSTDCGAACFAFICNRYNLDLPIAKLRCALGTNQIGTTAANLIKTAQELGFTAKGVKGTIEALSTVPLPAIAHCLIDRRFMHYVVLVSWTPKFARVMDPGVGRIEKWSHDRFATAWTGVLILLAPGVDFQPSDQISSPWRKLWRLFKPHSGVFVQTFVGAIFTTALGLGFSIYVQKIVDHVIPDGNRKLLNLLSLAMLLVLLFKLALGWMQSLPMARTAQKIDATLILAYYRHLMRLPQPFFDTMRVGEITSRVADAVKIRNFLNNSLLNLLINPLILIFSLSAMFFWSSQLALWTLLLIPANAVIYWAVNLLNREYQRRLMERAADFDSHLVESLEVQPLLRSFRLEDFSSIRSESRLVCLLKTSWKATLGGLGCSSAATLVTQVYMIGLLWLGTTLVLNTQLTPGQLISCYTLSTYLTGPIVGLIGLNASIQETLIATDRLFEVMDMELEKDQGSIEFVKRHAGDIRFEAVCFRHVGRSPSLHDITAVLSFGKITALVGESGCGKSTLLALIQRLYYPESGRVFIGEHDVNYYRLDSLRQHIAVVAQQTRLLTGTVIENLTLGETQPDMERILQLCCEVGILEFIEKLPQGFFTPLNENGTNLSGGQRQRMAVVRGLYVNAPILLLDEPTSALDEASESKFLEILLQQRNAGCTIVIATHAPLLIANADCVIKMNKGKIIATESRSDLLVPRTAAAVS